MDNYRHPMYARRKNVPPFTPAGEVFNVYPVVSPEKEYTFSGIDNMPLAMAYVPMQKWKNVMDAATGFSHGTIFQDLVMPFYGDKRCCEMRGDRF